MLLAYLNVCLQHSMKMTTTMKFSNAFLLMIAVIISCSFEAFADKSCDANELEQCSHFESCVTQSSITNRTTSHLMGTCHCLKNYKRDSNGHCVRTAEIIPGYVPLEGHSTSASSVAAAVLVPLTLIAVIGAFIYFGRRYQWWQKLRQPPVRLYDTVLIGANQDNDDDPPIA